MADQPKSFQLSSEIHAYIVDHGTPPDDVLQSLITETAELGAVAGMQVAPEQGVLLQILTAARRRALRGRGRHLHGLLVAVHRTRSRARRAPDLL